MKQLLSKYYFLLFTMFFVTTVISAQTTQEQLIGTWVFNYDASFAKIDSNAKTHLDKMDISRKERLENAYKGRTITFGADGSYLQQLADGRKVFGTWVLSGNGKDILVKNPEGKELNLKIKTLNSTSLILNPNDLGKGKSMLSDWHFSKN